METTKIETGQDYSAAMLQAFYVEELEGRFEMAAIAAPNLACWEVNF